MFLRCFEITEYPRLLNLFLSTALVFTFLETEKENLLFFWLVGSIGEINKTRPGELNLLLFERIC